MNKMVLISCTSLCVHHQKVETVSCLPAISFLRDIYSIHCYTFIKRDMPFEKVWTHLCAGLVAALRGLQAKTEERGRRAGEGSFFTEIYLLNLVSPESQTALLEMKIIKMTLKWKEEIRREGRRATVSGSFSSIQAFVSSKQVFRSTHAANRLGAVLI